MKKAALWALLAALLFALCSCTVLEGLSRSDALPDLRLLIQPAYEEEVPAEAQEVSDSAYKLDLWLDASQVMGGINPNEKSMYPHASSKYREGGFHYRYQNTTGMYETVLRCMLSAAEGSRVRILRAGNERLPDDYLLDQISKDLSAEALRSVRRDMLTYAIDPMPGIFQEFSGKKMTDSFYSLGTPKLNQIGSLNTKLLENPSLAKAMNTALEKQLHAIAKGYDGSLLATEDDGDYPLLYALNSLDLSRLSVITFDPAAIRRLNLADENGDPHALIKELLNERGVFDAGLSAGLYAFTLDYVGQLSTFASADFSDPLLWGRLDYSNYTGTTNGVLPMPRTLLTLVIGRDAQVDAFTEAFEAQLAASDTLKVPRGPQNGELTYAQNGRTVVQEPFSFDYDYTLISRTGIQLITQQTEGAELTAGDAPVSLSGSLHTVTIAPADGAQTDRMLTLRLPAGNASGSMTLNAEALANVEVSVESALLLSGVLPNHPDTVIPADAQSIVLRDQVYVFAPQQPQSPVNCAGLSYDGSILTVQLSVDGSALVPGYYRILFSADLPGESLTWNTPAWVKARDAVITNEQISAWETFAQLLTKYERKRNYISRPYQHAWGDADNTSYYGEPVPEFPPVMRAPGLAELVRQLQNAAHPDTMPYIRFGFDLFVTNQ